MFKKRTFTSPNLSSLSFYFLVTSVFSPKKMVGGHIGDLSAPHRPSGIENLGGNPQSR